MFFISFVGKSCEIFPKHNGSVITPKSFDLNLVSSIQFTIK